MYTVGLSSCGKIISDELFAAYRAAGIGAMEVIVSTDVNKEPDWNALAAMAAKHGVTLWSCHLPFSERVRIDDAAFAEETAARYAQLIRRASAVGIKTFVVHPSSEPIAEEDRTAHLCCAKKHLAALAELAAECGAQLAVEDLPRTCLGRDSADMEQLLAAHPALRVCFDTNHLLAEDPIAFIRAMGSRIVTTHISDYDFYDERHWLPGEGKLDWTAILQALQSVGYSGPWLYEVGFVRPASLEEPARNLICEDFAHNAREIFALQKPTPCAVAKKDLHRWR
ncbi:MAG: sugar phosphate isomerase/epimerase [Oscillospiraceae bacterium]|nr:sugar phosphate isomerase/epimerase [Oscillospiraceae bacterium]